IVRSPAAGSRGRRSLHWDELAHAESSPARVTYVATLTMTIVLAAIRISPAIVERVLPPTHWLSTARVRGEVWTSDADGVADVHHIWQGAGTGTLTNGHPAVSVSPSHQSALCR